MCIYVHICANMCTTLPLQSFLAQELGGNKRSNAYCKCTPYYRQPAQGYKDSPHVRSITYMYCT